MAQEAFEAMQNATRDRILTCADCPHFEPNFAPALVEGAGFCRKLRQRRLASTMACEVSFNDK